MHSLSTPDDASVVKFRGATYDLAVEAAQQALGPRVKVVAADRIRRGGIGGFFATELGVEVSVALHDETVDQALERLVAATAEEESSRWYEQLTSMAHSTAASTAAATPPAAPPQQSMTQLLTARTVVGDDTIVSHVTIDSPPAPIQTVVDQVPAVAEPVEVASTPVPTTAATVPAAAAPQAVSNAVSNTEPNVVPELVPARRRILLPTRGHVDLAVSAAAELARLTGEQLPGRRIAVHVVVTSDDGRSVEADAIIEDQP